MLTSGYIRDQRFEVLIGKIIPNEIPLLIALFYPINIEFEGNSFNLTAVEKEFISEWLEDTLLNDGENETTNNFLTSTLLYDANKDGYKGTIYYSICDKQINKFTIIESEYDHIFAGFLSVKTDNVNYDFVKDENAFLCLIRSKSKDHKPAKYKLKEHASAYYEDDDYGPIFGRGDVWISVDDKNSSDSHFELHANSSFMGLHDNTLSGGKMWNDNNNEKSQKYTFKIRQMQTFRIDIQQS